VFAVLSAQEARVSVAIAEPSYPYPLQRFDSTDGGKTWSRGAVVWGGSAGHAQTATLGSKRVLLFEGGDKARREHVLLLEIPPSAERPG
jgi:hypothetical protein